MEGVVKIISGVAIGVIAVSAIGFAAIQIHSIYHGGVVYTKTGHTLQFTDSTGKRLPWTQEVHLFIMEKGPGRELIRRDMQSIVNEEGGPTAICTKCCAYQDDIVFRKID